MPPEDRWRQFMDDPAYWNLFDAETVSLCSNIFGPTTPCKILMRRVDLGQALKVSS